MRCMADLNAVSHAARQSQRTNVHIAILGMLTFASAKLCESLPSLSGLIRKIDIRVKAEDARLAVLRLFEEFRIPSGG